MFKSINIPFRTFCEKLKVPVSKEVVPYQVYTLEPINKVYVPIFSTLQYNKSQQEQ